MSLWVRFSWFGLLWLCSAASVTGMPITLEIEVGDAHVVRVKQARQVAVGNSQVIQATAVSAHEVILFGKREGTTTVDIWGQGARQSFRVVVQAAGLQQRLAQVQQAISELPGLQVRLSGRHLVVEGERLSTDERARLKKLLNKYPDVIDLSNDTPWDPMVLLDVKVVELPVSSLQSLGVRWDADVPVGLQAGAAWSLGTVGFPTDSPGPLQGALSGAMVGLNGTLSSRLQALAQSGQAVLLAQPQLVARSGSPASFLAGGEVPYAQVDKDGKATTLFKKYGVQLNVTPRVSRQGAIRAAVEVEVSSIDPSVNTPAGPAMRVRKTSTEFNVRSGQTLVLSGFISDEQSVNRQGLPHPAGRTGGDGLLGPTETRRQRTELAVFVTTVLVDADHPDLMARAAQAESLVYDRLGQSPQLNLAVYGQPGSFGRVEHGAGHWHPAHPGLSQWHSQSNRRNTHSWSAFDSTPFQEP